MYVSKTLMDFQRMGAIGTYYEDLIASCPICHFSGYVSDFSQEIEESVKEKVMTELKPKSAGQKLRGFEECEFAAKIYAWQKRKNREIAHVYLIGSYLLRRATGELEQKRKGFQEQALGYFMKALTTDEFEPKERGIISYLIGELYRRTGRFEEAMFWYDRALKEKENPDWLEGLVEKQRELAKKRDSNNDI
jgi:tetratricopeptide (TPR) repeat protein